MITTETCQQWDAPAGEWVAVTVTVTEPARRSASRARGSARTGAPRDLSGLSSGSPLPEWWRDTAFAPGERLADIRTWVKPSAMRTHRAATVMPADPGRITDTAARRSA